MSDRAESARATFHVVEKHTDAEPISAEQLAAWVRSYVARLMELEQQIAMCPKGDGE